MQAQRKLADPAHTASPVDAAPVESVDYVVPQLGNGDLPTSPAIVLQAQLAARLAGATADAQGVAVAPEYKLPMALRIATIVTLSMALWGGIVLVAVKVIT